MAKTRTATPATKAAKDKKLTKIAHRVMLRQLASNLGVSKKPVRITQAERRAMATLRAEHERSLEAKNKDGAQVLLKAFAKEQAAIDAKLKKLESAAHPFSGCTSSVVSFLKACDLGDESLDDEPRFGLWLILHNLGAAINADNDRALLKQNKFGNALAYAARGLDVERHAAYSELLTEARKAAGAHHG